MTGLAVRQRGGWGGRYEGRGGRRAAFRTGGPGGRSRGLGSSFMAEHYARVLIAEREREVQRVARLALLEASVPRAREDRLRRRNIPVWLMPVGLRQARALVERIRNIRAGVASCDFRPSCVPEKGPP
jgi:hypothetical protein